MIRRTFPVLDNAYCCRYDVSCCTYTRLYSLLYSHASSHTDVASRVLKRTCVAGLLYSPVRPLVDVKVFRVLQRTINTSKAGPNLSLIPIDPPETSRVFTKFFQSGLVA